MCRSLLRGSAEERVDGGVVDVDALVDELAVGQSEYRTGLDLYHGVVVEAPDAGDLEDDHPTVLLPDVDQRVGQRLD